jgi:hypothetical protein
VKVPDAKCFIEAMQKETKDHELLGHWDIVLRLSIPPQNENYSGYLELQA